MSAQSNKSLAKATKKETFSKYSTHSNKFKVKDIVRSDFPEEGQNWLKAEAGPFIVCSFSRVQLIPWTVACQAPLPMGFPRQKHWSGLPFPSPGFGVI